MCECEAKTVKYTHIKKKIYVRIYMYVGMYIYEFTQSIFLCQNIFRLSMKTCLNVYILMDGSSHPTIFARERNRGGKKISIPM